MKVGLSFHESQCACEVLDMEECHGRSSGESETCDHRFFPGDQRAVSFMCILASRMSIESMPGVRHCVETVHRHAQNRRGMVARGLAGQRGEPWHFTGFVVSIDADGGCDVCQPVHAGAGAGGRLTDERAAELESNLAHCALDHGDVPAAGVDDFATP
jgi:hypothetical protein